MSELKDAKPCPFCGSRKLKFEGIGGVSYQIVQCRDCDAEGPHENDSERETSAVERWNRRAGDAA